MSTTIDERVVEMRFDNKQFEANVQTSIKSLDNLKKGLDLSESAKGLTAVSEAAGKVSLGGLSTAVDTVKMKFSALEVMAATALVNITNSAVNAGKRIVSALTLDSLKSGFNEYELKMNSVQTIMASTGESLETVNKYLEELNRYSDDTIYSFSDMTQNIGKFTNAGVKLEDAVMAIKGISNEAAISGANANEASRAMYNFAQALSAGHVKLIDWKSIENANMATIGFKEQLLEAAVAAGTLTKRADGMYEVMNVVNKQAASTLNATHNFNDSLANQWMTNEVLINTLKDYADVTTVIGEKATKAATQVKTFTQLIDTMKESLQSGWAQSVEIIVGNFEEAKTLFTEISDMLGGMIGKSAEGRNNLLKSWADMGGRESLIQSLRNSFDGLLSVLTPIKTAFEEIFPPQSAYDLLVITRAIESLTEKFILTEDRADKLKRTFKGVFAVFDILKKVVVGTWNAISPFVGGLADVILSIAAVMGDWAVSLNEALESTDGFTAILTSFFDVFKRGLANPGEFFKSLIANIKGFVESLKEKFDFSGFDAFNPILERINSRLTQVKNSVVDMKEAAVSTFKSIQESLASSKIVQMLTRIWDIVKTISGKLVTGLSDAFGNLADKVSDANFDTLLDVLNGISLGGIAIAITKFLSAAKEGLGEVGGLSSVFSGILTTLDSVRGCFEAYQTQLKAGALLKIATAIAILTASIFVIALIDSDKLAASLGAITVLFGDLMASMAIFNRISGGSKNTLKACTAMIAMSAAVAILAGALKSVASLDVEQLSRGLVGVGVLTAMVVTSAKVLSDGSGQMIKGISGLILFAASIKILVSAVKDLSSLNWEQLAIGLVGVGVLMAEVIAFLKLSDTNGKMFSTAVGIVVLSSALKILASACRDMSSMSWEQLAVGLAGIGGLLTELAIFTNVAGNAKHVVTTGIALIAIGAAMKIFAAAIGDLGKLDWSTIGTGLASMGIALAGVLMFIHLVPDNMLSIGASLLGIGIALTMLAVAIKTMSSSSWGELAVGLAAMGVALLELAVALNFMNGTLAGSAALLVAAAAISVLTPSLILLGAMSWENILKSLTTLAGVFIVLGVAGAVLGPLVPSILGLAGALALIGIGVGAVGAGLLAAGLGIEAVAIGLGTLATLGAAGTAAVAATLTAIISAIASTIPAILVKIGEGLIAIAQTIIVGAPTIIEAFMVIMKGLVTAIVEITPLVVDGIFVLLESLLSTLVEYTPTLLQAGFDIVISLLEGIANNISAVVQKGIDIVLGLLDGIKQKIPDIIQAGVDLLLAFINGLNDGIKNNRDAVIESINELMKTLVETAVQAITKTNETFITIGKNIISGIVQGIKSGLTSVADAAKEVATSALDSVKSALGIHSPSRAFAEVGKYSDEGLVAGLMQYASKVRIAAEDVGNGALDSMASVISGIADVVDGNVDYQPSIRPILDLSNIESGAGRLSTMLNQHHVATIAGQYQANKSSDDRTSTEAMLSRLNTMYAETMAQMLNNSSTPVNVNVTLDGDAAKVFKLVRTENDKFIKSNGYSPLTS